MTYITQADIEQFTGFTYTNFTIAGAVMSAPQWAAMIAAYIPYVEQIIHRYCNVTSFDPTTEIVEYHSGRGASNDDMGGYNPSYYYYGTQQGSAYITSDRTFYLREPLYSMTTVEEDTSSKTEVPNWVTRVVRSALVPGDYEVRTQNEVSAVVFNQNVPMCGEWNVRITYNCGYGTATAQYAEIKLCALRMMANLLLAKKKIQEVTTIRAQGIRDFSQMFDIMNESQVLTENIRFVLDKYKRWPIEGDMFL
jgi:hypothetical protein